MAEGALPDPADPPDQQARDRIRSELTSTLFVEAGAGSGKTSALVGRVLALVTTGVCELSNIAAITFTEKAAAELRDRIRRELEQTVAESPGDPEGERCRVALDQLDGSAIGTLHAFAQRILTEYPIEAGLPPRIEVLDEVSSTVQFDQQWSMFQDALLSDPAMERTLLLLFGAGVRPEALRYLAQAFQDNWDLVEERVPETEPEPPPVHGLLRPLLAELPVLLAERCADPEDKLRRRIEDVHRWLSEASRIEDEAELLESLSPKSSSKAPSFKVGNIGRTGNWDNVADIRTRVVTLGASVEAVRTRVAEACARRIGSEIRRFTLQSAAERQRSGLLEFHDLLVMARSLLRHPRHGADVRARLHQRYRRLLLDEFQDTDPIQIELAVRIASADPAADATAELPWDAVETEPGHLFVVGDPKQSIYRFRRADIALFLAAAQRFGAGHGLVELTTNFRAVEPIIDWVNVTFGRLMDGSIAANAPIRSQPGYLRLDPVRPAGPVGAALSVLGRAPHPNELSADELRAAEAADVAAAVARISQEGWTVGDKAGTGRKAKLGDITVLVPARTSLPFLEDALEAANISFRTESSSLVYASRVVRDLVMVLRAVDDPTNYLHIVSALRTPLLACGDDDLFRFLRERGGRWDYRFDQSDTVPADDPVRQSLEYLRRLHEDRQWVTPSELLDRIVRERCAMELGFAQGRPRDVWRRLRFVVEQARAWFEATGGSLRQYLAWVDRQAAEGARVEEAMLPETDDDAVRIMTVHAAKGLEFPVTIVSGMSTQPQQRPAPAQVVFPTGGSVGYRFSGQVTTHEYEDWKPIDEQMGFDERIRLLYVACTRARDHLVVSLHRRARANDPEPTKRTNAELLVEGMGDLLDRLPDAAETGKAVPSPVVEPPPAPVPYEEWLGERTAALERASQPTTVAATALTDEGGLDAEGDPDAGLQKRPRDLDLAPWLKGRYGSSVGRAVHGVLQTVDLATGEGLEGAVAAQCEAEAIPERATDVRELVTAALGSASVIEAAAGQHWREVYVCTPVDSRMLEGYIDLLYRTPDGLVVVDYKTASTAAADELDRRIASYRNQGASYALTVGAVTGEPVARVTFLFLTPEGAVERHLGDFDAAVRHVRGLVMSGHEVLTS